MRPAQVLQTTHSIKKKKYQRDINHFFFFWGGGGGGVGGWGLRPFQEYFTYIEGGRKPENPEKNHLTIRKQNLAFPHMTQARLEPQR